MEMTNMGSDGNHPCGCDAEIFCFSEESSPELLDYIAVRY